ncbi:uncharacterized protein [Lepeophtheirus salmonis]|uniref:uncharacterized protein isoform X1 n=1 Tax=Lepeophtheirus salmonis TaxID=72036 RepID=UPI001AE9627C|nr:uncharacterized protein LOC121114687 isoform X1 [Lepeophtheirus salmonis]
MLHSKAHIWILILAVNIAYTAADEELSDVIARNFLSVTSGDITINLIPIYFIVILFFLFKIAYIFLGLDYSAPNIAHDFEGTSSGYGPPSEPSYSSYSSPSTDYGAPSSGGASSYQTKGDKSPQSFFNFPSHRLLDLFTYLPYSGSHPVDPGTSKSDQLSNKVDDWKPSKNPLYLQKKNF